MCHGKKKKIEISFHPSSLLLSLPFFLPPSPFLSLITSQSSSFFFLPFFLLSHIPNLFISLSFFLPVSSSIFSSSFYVIFLLNLMNPSLSKVLLLSTVSHFIPVCSSQSCLSSPRRNLLYDPYLHPLNICRVLSCPLVVTQPSNRYLSPLIWLHKSTVFFFL